MSENNLRSQVLKVEINSGRLEVSIGVDTLCHAVGYGLEMRCEEFEITDNDVFASEILSALKVEEEDGTTVLHRALDSAAFEAIENGAHGIKFVDEE